MIISTDKLTRYKLNFHFYLGTDADASLIVNGFEAIRIHAHTENNPNQASNFVLAYCPTNGTVFVRALNDDYVYPGNESTFSGVFIGGTSD